MDIVRDIQPPQECIPKEATPHIDNSHMIEIEVGGAKISLCNGADPELVAKTLYFFRKVLMIGDITVADEIYIVCGYTDMRKSIDGLCV